MLHLTKSFFRAMLLLAFCTVSIPALATPVLEFYNTDLDHYFITAAPGAAEYMAAGLAGPGWTQTGYSFEAGGTTPVCRFYGSMNPGPNSHFYTVNQDACAALKQLQATTPDTEKRWNFEGLDFSSTPPNVDGTCPTGTVPVYRAYNNGWARGVDSNHRITSNLAAIQEVVARGWINEGVVMCAPDAAVPAAAPQNTAYKTFTSNYRGDYGVVISKVSDNVFSLPDNVVVAVGDVFWYDPDEKFFLVTSLGAGASGQQLAYARGALFGEIYYEFKAQPNAQIAQAHPRTLSAKLANQALAEAPTESVVIVVPCGDEKPKDGDYTVKGGAATNWSGPLGLKIGVTLKDCPLKTIFPGLASKVGNATIDVDIAGDIIYTPPASSSAGLSRNTFFGGVFNADLTATITLPRLKLEAPYSVTKEIQLGGQISFPAFGVPMYIQFGMKPNILFDAGYSAPSATGVEPIKMTVKIVCTSNTNGSGGESKKDLMTCTTSDRKDIFNVEKSVAVEGHIAGGAAIAMHVGVGGKVTSVIEAGASVVGFGVVGVGAMLSADPDPRKTSPYCLGGKAKYGFGLGGEFKLSELIDWTVDLVGVKWTDPVADLMENNGTGTSLWDGIYPPNCGSDYSAINNYLDYKPLTLSVQYDGWGLFGWFHKVSLFDTKVSGVKVAVVATSNPKFTINLDATPAGNYGFEEWLNVKPTEGDIGLQYSDYLSNVTPTSLTVDFRKANYHANNFYEFPFRIRNKLTNELIDYRVVFYNPVTSKSNYGHSSSAQKSMVKRAASVKAAAAAQVSVWVWLDAKATTDSYIKGYQLRFGDLVVRDVLQQPSEPRIGGKFLFDLPANYGPPTLTVFDDSGDQTTFDLSLAAIEPGVDVTQPLSGVVSNLRATRDTGQLVGSFSLATTDAVNALFVQVSGKSSGQQCTIDMLAGRGASARIASGVKKFSDCGWLVKRPEAVLINAAVTLVDGRSEATETLELAATDVAPPSPLATGHSPSSATLNQVTTFTYTGSGLTAGMGFTVTNCDTVVDLGGSSTSRSFSCIPRTAGPQTLTIKTAPGGTVLYTGPVTVTAQTAVVMGISSSGVSLNQVATFTYMGSGLTAGMGFTVTNCDTVVDLGGSSSSRSFSCIPRTAGPQTLTIKTAPGGTVLYTGPVTVTAPQTGASLYDTFDGTSLDSSVWSVVSGPGGYSVGASEVQLGAGSYAQTAGKKLFSGSKIVIESRFAGEKSSGRDTYIDLVDVATGDLIEVGDTSYNAMGFYARGTGEFGLSPSGLGTSTPAWMEYRFTFQGNSLTIERGNTLASITESHNFVLAAPITGKTFSLLIGTGGNDGIYSPGWFDWVRVTATDAPITPTPPASYVAQGGLTWMPVTFTRNWADANAYCAGTTINGQTGWRLPTQVELSSLFSSGAMNGQGWTLESGTWSSTSYGAGFHYGVGLAPGNGIVHEGDDTHNLYVACVRPTAQQPAGYVTQGGLTWMPVTFQKPWADANAYCTGTTINGLAGWRLPTQVELLSLFGSGAMNGQGWWLTYTWSSTAYQSYNHIAVDLSTLGRGSGDPAADTYNFDVTCVH